MKNAMHKISCFIKQLVFRTLLLMIVLASVGYYFYFYKASDTGVITGKIRDIRLGEVSGVAVSEVNADTLWVHNDSGHKPMLYAISGRGNIRERFILKDVTLIDIEDIAMFKDQDGNSMIMLTDLGSNSRLRNESPTRIVIFKEPDLLKDLDTLASLKDGQIYEISDYKTYEIAYPDYPISEINEVGIFANLIEHMESDNPNIEAVAVDSLAKEVLFFTKTYKGKTDVLSYPLDELTQDTANMVMYKGTIDIKSLTTGYHVDYRHLIFSPVNFPYAVTGADVSKDQKTLLIRTYGNVWKWDRGYSDKPFSDFVLVSKPQYIMSAFEPLGESVGVDSDNLGYYTISEGFFSKIYYNRLDK